MTLDYPKSCSYCYFPANIIIFEELPVIMDGAILSLREKEAKCIDHLRYEDMMLDSIY